MLQPCFIYRLCNAFVVNYPGIGILTHELSRVRLVKNEHTIGVTLPLVIELNGLCKLHAQPGLPFSSRVLR